MGVKKPKKPKLHLYPYRNIDTYVECKRGVNPHYEHRMGYTLVTRPKGYEGRMAIQKKTAWRYSAMAEGFTAVFHGSYRTAERAARAENLVKLRAERRVRVEASRGGGVITTGDEQEKQALHVRNYCLLDVFVPKIMCYPPHYITTTGYIRMSPADRPNGILVINGIFSRRDWIYKAMEGGFRVVFHN